MIRRIASSAADAFITALLALAGFRVALAVVPCADLGECAILTPLIILAIVIAVGLYFVVGWQLFRTTIARHLIVRDRSEQA